MDGGRLMGGVMEGEVVGYWGSGDSTMHRR